MKNERGSVALFVLLSMLFFLAIVTSVGISVQNKETRLDAEYAKIKANYEKDLGNEEKIYNDKKNISGELIMQEVGDKRVKFILKTNVAENETYGYKIYIKDNIENDNYRILKEGTTSNKIIEAEVVTFFDVGIKGAKAELIKNSDTITINGTYIYEDLKIKTAEEFRAFAENVNGGKKYEGKIITQIADIDLDCTETNQWTPIANENDKFRGTYDGKEHTIEDIYINSNVLNQGLFGWNNGTIENLKVKGNIITTRENVGGITANNKGNIINCANDITIQAASINGGIAGTNDGIIDLCKNYNVIKTTNELSNSNSGGIAGANNENAIIKRCKNSGSTEGQNDYIGGIVGINGGTIIYCCNIGTVFSAKDTIGGIAGYQTYSSNAMISNCYNAGEISGPTSKVGGIIGENNNGKICNCYNIGKIEQLNDKNCVVGNNDTNGIISNSYILASLEKPCICETNDGGTIDAISATKTELEMKTAEFITILNVDGESFKADTNNINNGYPILSWE